jgi:predicted ester cyclase
VSASGAGDPPVPGDAAAAGAVLEGTRGPWRNLTDYILGITHEIWESRQVDRIHDYYSADCVIYTLGGIIRGADTVVRNTYETLATFPDRLLLGDAVIGSRESPGRFYSSHRITSPMTHLGPGSFGPPTGRRVSVVTIADCVVEDGVITTEWLVRDNHGLARQLGLDPRELAQRAAAQPPAPPFAQWLAGESERVQSSPVPPGPPLAAWSDADAGAFAAAVLRNAWSIGDPQAHARHYHPYAVLHDSQPVASGRAAIERHGAGLRQAFDDVALSVDHVCVQPDDVDGRQVAVRWGLVARQRGDAWGVGATGRRVYILGVTHWKIVAGRIAAEWTLFDRTAVLVQLLRAAT